MDIKYDVAFSRKLRTLPALLVSVEEVVGNFEAISMVRVEARACIAEGSPSPWIGLTDESDKPMSRTNILN